MFDSLSVSNISSKHQKWHEKLDPQVRQHHLASLSLISDLDIFTKTLRIRELHMLTGCHSNICCIKNDAWVLLTLPIICFLHVWQPICLKYIVKASEMTPKIGSFHWGSWAIWPPRAPRRRVLRTMYWSQDIHNVRQHSENAWKNVIFNEGEVILMVIRVNSENWETYKKVCNRIEASKMATEKNHRPLLVSSTRLRRWSACLLLCNCSQQFSSCSQPQPCNYWTIPGQLQDSSCASPGASGPLLTQTFQWTPLSGKLWKGSMFHCLGIRSIAPENMFRYPGGSFKDLDGIWNYFGRFT